MNNNFSPDQIFTGIYPPEAAGWCNNSGEYYISEIEPRDNQRRFQIKRIPEPTQSELNLKRIEELEEYLASTDWYASRLADSGTPIPEDVLAARRAARVEISALRVE